MPAATFTRSRRLRRTFAAVAVLGAASAIAAAPASAAIGDPVYVARDNQPARMTTTPSWGDIETLVQLVLRDAYLDTQADLRASLEAVKVANQAEKTA